MKNLEPSQVKQLLEIIQSKPGQRLVHFTDNEEILCKSLHQFSQENDNNYYLYCTEKSFYEHAKEAYNDQSHIRVVNFNTQRPRYMIQGIEYDYLITNLDFTQEDKSTFLEKCYPIIRTGGNIIIIIPNSHSNERDEWQVVLEEQYYVSVNIIDNIFDDYDVIVAKRMHGWGN
jgi:phospholipid N-methyltransferase